VIGVIAIVGISIFLFMWGSKQNKYVKWESTSHRSAGQGSGGQGSGGQGSGGHGSG
jgi:hypothetical protein